VQVCHQGSEQLRGRAYMAQQELRTVITPALHALHWFQVGDLVMGGRSSSLIENPNGLLRFSGEVNSNGGGFCSCRTRDLGNMTVPPCAAGIKLVASGSLHRFIFKLTVGAAAICPSKDSFSIFDVSEPFMRPRLKGLQSNWESMSEAGRQNVLREEIIFRHTFPPLGTQCDKEDKQEFFLPFSGFDATLNGALLANLIPDVSNIKHIGLSAGIFGGGEKKGKYEDGPFEVLVHALDFVSRKSEEEESF